MWEFYLAGSETAFRYQNLVVFQVQLVKRIDALPTDPRLHVDRRAPPARAARSIEARPRMAGE